MADLKFEVLPDPGDRYQLGEVIGRGVYSEVYEAIDTQAGGKRVAVKILTMTLDIVPDIREEFRILRDLSSHPNLPDFYGVYMRKATGRNDSDKIWFVIEMCEGGSVVELAQGLIKQNKKMTEDHIAYILKETVKAVVHLHEKHVMHRDVKGSNILLTKEGEVKLVDFGLSKDLKSTMGRTSTVVGSPCWMAPEVVSSSYNVTEEGAYDNRADVWALGITAIELADGKAPFQDMHPTRALFQIVRNPPPTLYRPANWSKLLNDFITECLEKNPENRPFMVEILEHPFLTALPEKDYHLTQELKALCEEVNKNADSRRRGQLKEIIVRDGALKTDHTAEPEPMRVEDLAALEPITEEAVLSELQERLRRGHCYTFVGDVLLLLNPNEQQKIYGPEVHTKYQFKSRSDNAPHIFTVADCAYQDVMHNEEPQMILLSGESASGKTTSLIHLMRHLAFLGKSGNGASQRVEKAYSILQAFGNAATPLNANSTRHVMQMQLTFGSTGKLSGAIFWVFQLEKWRVTTPLKQQANFHMFYYWYDAMAAEGKLQQYGLVDDRQYRYLRSSQAEPGTPTSTPGTAGPREDSVANVRRFRELLDALRDIGFEDDQIHTLWNTLAAILLLGEVQFQDDGKGQAELKAPEQANQVAKLLGVDEKKFAWALINYCVVQQGTAVRRRHTVDEAQEARDVLARGIYFRLVDWVVNIINFRLSFARAVFGDTYSVTIMDMFGFECFKTNSLEQLFVNTLNEQLQYHYNQRVFAWEMQEQEEEDIPVQTLQFYDNKPTVDALMVKPTGLFYVLDEASRNTSSADFIAESLRNSSKGPHVRATGAYEFSVAHYTGTVTYNATEMSEKNRDFLPPEMIETMRQSTDNIIRQLFTNQLSRTGNLTLTTEEQSAATSAAAGGGKKGKWGSALVAESNRMRKYNTESKGQYSQTRRMRTSAAVFRAMSLELLRGLAIGAGSGGTHFVRCLRADITGAPRGFQPEVVRQQLRALAVLDTALARQQGFPHRITFPEFIRRYKFLAFDFDENVEVTKENSRLLLVRLKMEGWLIGKSKVFLKYYNEEYLSRTYESQVKKIVKVQTMMRAFLAKRNVASKLLKFRQNSVHKEEPPTPKKTNNNKKDLSKDEAATIIQKQYRGYNIRKKVGPVKGDMGKIEKETAIFIRQYCKKWKAKSMFQVLLLYRAAKHQDLVYFSQQVHLYNQNAMGHLSNSSKPLELNNIDPGSRATIELGKPRPAVWKIPFRLTEHSFFDTSSLVDPPRAFTLAARSSLDEEQESWDAPLRRDYSAFWKCRGKISVRDQEVQTCSSPFNEQHDLSADSIEFIQMPFCRDPDMLNQPSPGVNKKKYVAAQYKGIQPYGNGNKNKFIKSNINERNDYNIQRNQPINNRSTGFDGPKPYQKKVGTPKKVAPRPPGTSFGDSMFNNNVNRYDSENNAVGDSSSSRVHGLSGARQSAIAEMEMRGRRMDTEQEGDAPPFNFQAMLRKTNYQRGSMKRNTPAERNSPAHVSRPTNRSLVSDNSTSYGSSNVVFNSSSSNFPRNRTPSPTFSFNSAISENEENQYNQHFGRSSKDQFNASRKGRAVDSATELVPGIVFEGQVADL